MRVLTGLVACLVVVRTIASFAGGGEVTYRQTLLIQMEVTNLERSVDFYTSKLGFKVTEARPDLKFIHLSTNVPGLEIGLNEVAAPAPRGSIVLNIGVADADEARKALEAKGVVFRGETVLIPGKVKLAPFADPDGHRLRFAGPPPTTSR